MAKNKFKKTYYYRDELNDDFAALQIKPINIDESFKYEHGKFYWCCVFIVSLFIKPLVFIISKICYGTTIKNKKVLKKVQHTGYFLYSNHTSAFDPINHSCLVEPTKYTAIIASIDSFSIKGLKDLVHFVGAIPVPLNIKMYKNFSKCLKYHIENKHKIVIYPEAHIWPYYNNIRPFKSVSFRYPVELNAPILIATTVYKKRKFLKTPKIVIYLQGPIYPKKELSFKEQIQDLRDQTYEIMKKIVSENKSLEFNHYEKID